MDYSSEEEEGTDELTSLDTGSSDTSSMSSMGKQAILEEVSKTTLVIKFAYLRDITNRLDTYSKNNSNSCHLYPVTQIK